jgi:hypothetical protein
MKRNRRSHCAASKSRQGAAAALGRVNPEEASRRSSSRVTLSTPVGAALLGGRRIEFVAGAVADSSQLILSTDGTILS